LDNSILKSPRYFEVTYPDKETNYSNLLSRYISNNIFNKTGSLLDVGCGNGEHLKAFNKIGYDVFGIDISPRVKEIKNFRTKQINFECGFELSEKFDFIFCKSVIEHIRNVDVMADSLYHNLKKDGKICIMTPSWEHCYQKFYNCHTHYTPFMKESLENILLMHNFKNVKVSYFYQLPSVWKYPFMKCFCKLINFLKIPYKKSKLIRFSREVMLLAEATK